MHSFEVDQTMINSKRKTVSLQSLWLKNTFDTPIRIENITCHDKELSIQVMVSKELKEVKPEQYCCFSSIPLALEECKQCKGVYRQPQSDKNKIYLKPNGENEDIKIRYEYQMNKSKTIEIKYITVWTNESYIPIPVFIYDKTLACSFESYTIKEGGEYPFDLLTSTCHVLPSYKQLDFGPIAAKYSHRREFKLINLNPMPVFIQRVRRTQAICEGDRIENSDQTLNNSDTNLIQLVPVVTVDIFSNKVKRNFADEDKIFNKLYDAKEEEQTKAIIASGSDLTVPPNSIMHFYVELINPTKMTSSNWIDYEASIHFSSFQTPDFKIPVSFQVYTGDITLFPSDMVRFPPSIPGVTQSKTILARSTIDKTVYIKSVTSSNPNKVVVKVISNTLEKKINKEIIEISTVPFDYINSFIHFRREVLDYMKSGRRNQLNEACNDDQDQIDSTLTYFDILAWQVEQKQWDNRESPKSTDTSSIITIETNMIQNITLPVSTVITKPFLLSQDTYVFDKIEVGTETRGTITIHNPSPNPLEVSFFIAPANFMENIIDQLLNDHNLPKWKIL